MAKRPIGEEEAGARREYEHARRYWRSLKDQVARAKRKGEDDWQLRKDLDTAQLVMRARRKELEQIEFWAKLDWEQSQAPAREERRLKRAAARRRKLERDLAKIEKDFRERRGLGQLPLFGGER